MDTKNAFYRKYLKEKNIDQKLFKISSWEYSGKLFLKLW